SIAKNKTSFSLLLRSYILLGHKQPANGTNLTVVNTFSTLFPEKYFLSFVIPPFHLMGVTALIISGLHEVELGVELGWNFM
ncbi:MAG: hypothetical protein SPD82_04570, partial [Prevotella sp.]|nr:hypothetical protein [Prevotella sp.]